MVEVIPDVIAAGPFSTWLREFRAALQSNVGTNVPCGECRGCCRSGYPVPMRPQDVAALAAVPVQFVITMRTAHGLRPMITALDDGRCPMLEQGNCSIYAARPQTCRDYDCRVFAAAGIEAGESDRSEINRRVRAWRFTYEMQQDVIEHAAVRKAAAFIRNCADAFSAPVPTSPSGIAVLAVKVYPLFIDASEHKDPREIARAVLEASRAFDESAHV